MKQIFSDLLRENTAVNRHSLRSEPYSIAHSPALEDLAHDLRQPLGVIETITYYLELTQQDESTCAHLQRIRAMVAEANRILERAGESCRPLAFESSSC